MVEGSAKGSGPAPKGLAGFEGGLGGRDARVAQAAYIDLGERLSRSRAFAPQAQFREEPAVRRKAWHRDGFEGRVPAQGVDREQVAA